MDPVHKDKTPEADRTVIDPAPSRPANPYDEAAKALRALATPAHPQPEETEPKAARPVEENGSSGPRFETGPLDDAESPQETTIVRPETTTPASLMPGIEHAPANPSGGAGIPVSAHRAEYRQWLERQSRDDLIALLIDASDRVSVIEHTGKVVTQPRPDSTPSPARPQPHPFPDDLKYVRLPLRRAPTSGLTPTWRIVLVALDQTAKLLGVQLDGEITIGRAAVEASPDLDLVQFGARDKGVSRLHARLQPDMDHLTLIDNGSSNGTFLNRVQLAPYTRHVLKDGDLVTFGRMDFQIRIVNPPSVLQTKTLL